LKNQKKKVKKLKKIKSLEREAAPRDNWCLSKQIKQRRNTKSSRKRLIDKFNTFS
jgi:hypothetical protein